MRMSGPAGSYIDERRWGNLPLFRVQGLIVATACCVGPGLSAGRLIVLVCNASYTGLVEEKRPPASLILCITVIILSFSVEMHGVVM